MNRRPHMQAFGIPQLVVQQSEGDLEINWVVWVIKVARGPFLASWNIKQSQLVSCFIVWLLYLREVFPAHLFLELFNVCVSCFSGGLAGIEEA